MKKILAIIFCALIMLPLLACTGNDKPTEQTAEPSEEAVSKPEQPTGEPLAYTFIGDKNKDITTPKPGVITETPTEKPTDAVTEQPTDVATEQPTGEPSAYTFDEKTGEYSDEYLSFTLPAGFTVLNDAAADPYLRFISFTNPDPTLQANSVNYNVADTAPEGADVPLSELTQEDLEEIFKTQFEQAFQSEVQIKTVSLAYTTKAGCPALTYEYTVIIAGTELHQVVVMIEEGDLNISIVYTFSESDWEIYRDSAKTVMPKA